MALFSALVLNPANPLHRTPFPAVPSQLLPFAFNNRSQVDNNSGRNLMFV
jgi:hypothetical protein